MTTFVLQGARAAAPYLINTASRVALTYANQVISNALNPQTLEGPRLESLHIQTSRDGAPMPRVFGRARLAGQIIWASQFRETVSQTSQGRSGKGGGSARIKNYSYSISFAIGLCEGQITSVERIWANGQPLQKGDYNCRVYTGSETQNPDPIIALIEGNSAPAFRGTAYIVFEDFPLDDFGARLPQINVEVLRQPVRKNGQVRLEDLISGVDLIPGSGEFVYATSEQEDVSIAGETRTINVNNLQGSPDVLVALDQLQSQLPNCGSVSLVTSWFGDSLRCGDCQIYPAVETKDRIAQPDNWRAGGHSRDTARHVSQREGRPVYGGTPSDASIVSLIKNLKSRGLKTCLYPFVLMDLSELKTGQRFPWRGRISCFPETQDQTLTAQMQVDQFFGICAISDFSTASGHVDYSGPNEHSYRRMILHYAYLCKLAGGVDSFIIGSELHGITTIRGVNFAYPAVAHLQQLASDVRQILGAQTRITYAADWSEYFGHHKDGHVHFHLDPLWADDNIDAVGIDAYFPLSDSRGGDSFDQHNSEILSQNVEGGEGYDWYYASQDYRLNNHHTDIADGVYDKPWIYRNKDIRNWWSRPHYNRVNGVEDLEPTAWVPQSKPVWLTEVGCPAVDKGSNQPNVFFDPKSSESALPYFSSGERDDLAQRRYLEALIGYWQMDAGHNPTSNIYAGPMIDPEQIHVWCWDARPYPDFPVRRDIWSDGDNWSRGHWLSGRVGTSLLPDIVSEIVKYSGAGAPDVSAINGIVTGYVLDRPMSARAALQPLADIYGFDCTETPSGLKFHALGEGRHFVLSDADIAQGENAQPAITRQRSDARHRVQDVRLHFIDISHDYQRGLVSAQDRLAARDHVTDIQAPLAMGAGHAKTVCQTILDRSGALMQTLDFTLMPGRLDIRPGDSVSVPSRSDLWPDIWTVERLDGARERRVSLRPAVQSSPLITSGTVPTDLPPVPSFSAPDVKILDIVHLGGDAERAGPLVTAYCAPWVSTQISAVDQSVEVPSPGRFGYLTSDLLSAPTGRLIHASTLTVCMLRAELSSAPLLDVLAGANALALHTALGWEVIQYLNAELTAPNEYRLSGLLRGQTGSDGVMAQTLEAGAQIITLGAGLLPLPLANDLRGAPVTLTTSTALGYDEDVSFNYAAVHLKPLSPVHIRARHDGETLHLTWIRRSRLGADDWASLDIPLGEAAEAYQVKLMDDEVVIYETMVDTTACTIDLNAITLGQNEEIIVEIAQISQRCGAGFEARRAITLSA